jgi:hypothetical protein
MSDIRATEPDEVATLTVWAVQEFKFVILNVNPSEVEVVAPSVGVTETGRLVTLALAVEVSVSNPTELVARTSNLMCISMSSSDSTYVNPVAALMGVKEPEGLEPRNQRYV